MMASRKIENGWILGLILVASCMRVPISGVGPLVTQISESLSLSASTAGMLTTIPLLIFALVAPLVSHLTLVIPSRVQISACVIFLATGILLRSYLGLWGLFLGTALVGIGIGTLNVILPLFVKTNFVGRIGVVMASYTATMTLFSAIASGSVSTLSSVLGNWSHALGIFAILPILAFLVWIFVSRGIQDPSIIQEEEQSNPPLFCRTNWYAAAFFGLQSFLYFGIIAWLPSILAVFIQSDGQIAIMMFVMQLASLLTNFAMPPAIQRGTAKRRSVLGMCCAITYLSGSILVLLSLTLHWLAWPAILTLGLAGGMSISYILTFISIAVPSRKGTARLSAFTQCVGYLIAAPGPFLIGALTDLTGEFVVPLYIFVGVSILFLYFGQILAAINEQTKI